MTRPGRAEIAHCQKCNLQCSSSVLSGLHFFKNTSSGRNETVGGPPCYQRGIYLPHPERQGECGELTRPASVEISSLRCV